MQVSPLHPTNEQSANNNCYSNKLKTESRLQKYIFSKPMTLYMGLRLFSKHKITNVEPLDIALLLKENPSKHLAALKERSYTDHLDNQLSSLRPEQVNYNQGDVDSYLKAFNTDSVDFIIEYPSTISNSTILSNKNKLFSYPIKGAKDYNLGHIMCKNTPSNKRFIQDINKTLTSLYDSQYFINILYLEVDENSQKDFYRYYDEAFKIK